MEQELRSLRERVFFWQKDQKLYRALDASKAEFRLLVVSPGRLQDPLQVELRSASLKGKWRSRPKYETISYHWGEPADVAAIQINKQSVSVPANAAAALRCMRDAHTERVLWIDAVCINQADLDERAHQVNMMADVYSNATGNLIYLGEANALIDRAFESIYTCLEDIKKVTRNFEKVQGTPMDYLSANYNFQGGSMDNLDKEAVADIFSNPWFRYVRLAR